MAGSKEIRTKIKSVENTRKITRAMEMVAAAKMRKAQDRMRAAQPVILCSTHVRRFLRKITERLFPSVAVLSNAEISPMAKLMTAGVVRYEN